VSQPQLAVGQLYEHLLPTAHPQQPLLKILTQVLQVLQIHFQHAGYELETEQLA
jgi:hypothetical protein